MTRLGWLPKSPPLTLTHAAGACPGLKLSKRGVGDAPGAQEHAVSFPARLQHFCSVCGSGIVIICLPLTTSPSVSSRQRVSFFILWFLEQWTLIFIVTYKCCLNQCSLIGKGANSPLNYKQYTISCPWLFSGSTKRIGVINYHSSYKGAYGNKVISWRQKDLLCFAFYASTKGVLQYLTVLSGVFGIVVCWCSSWYYRYMLFRDLKRLTKKKGWTETLYRKSHLLKGNLIHNFSFGWSIYCTDNTCDLNTWCWTGSNNFVLLFEILTLHWDWYTPVSTTAELGLNPWTPILVRDTSQRYSHIF